MMLLLAVTCDIMVSSYSATKICGIATPFYTAIMHLPFHLNSLIVLPYLAGSFGGPSIRG